MNETLYSFFRTYLKYVEIKRPHGKTKNALKLAEECGEVAEAIFALKGSKRKIAKIAAENQTPRTRLIEELGDVIVVALNICTAADVGYEEVLKYSIDKMSDKMARIKRERNNGGQV